MSTANQGAQGERAFAYAALLWVLVAIAQGCSTLFRAGSGEISSVIPLGLAISAVLFFGALLTGYRNRFVLGRRGVSTRLRRLSGSLGAVCFATAWGVIAYAYSAGGGVAVRSTVQDMMPSTLGLSLGVVGTASLCLFLWECTAAVSEIRKTESRRSLILATVLSLTMALICVAALSSVVVGRVYFFGGS